MATSRTDYQREAQAAGVTFYSDANDLCEEHPEVVILATSILSLEAVLSALPVARLKRSTLFVDVLSVKEFPKRLMLSLLPREVWACHALSCIIRPASSNLEHVSPCTCPLRNAALLALLSQRHALLHYATACQ